MSSRGNDECPDDVCELDLPLGRDVSPGGGCLLVVTVVSTGCVLAGDMDACAVATGTTGAGGSVDALSFIIHGKFGV